MFLAASSEKVIFFIAGDFFSTSVACVVVRGFILDSNGAVLAIGGRRTAVTRLTLELELTILAVGELLVVAGFMFANVTIQGCDTARLTPL